MLFQAILIIFKSDALMEVGNSSRRHFVEM